MEQFHEQTFDLVGVISSYPARVDSISSLSMTHCVHSRSRAVSEYFTRVSTFLTNYLYKKKKKVWQPVDDTLTWLIDSVHLSSVSYEQTAITYVWKNDEGTLRKSPSLTSLNAYLIKNQTITCPIKVSWRGELKRFILSRNGILGIDRKKKKKRKRKKNVDENK